MTETRAVPGQVPLPGFGSFPDFSASPVKSDYVRREMTIADNRRRLAAIKQLREALLKWDRESDPRFPAQDIIIRITVGRSGVGAVVDFRDHRVGSAGVRHRLAGALPLNAGDVLGHGPRGGLRRALSALLEVTED